MVFGHPTVFDGLFKRDRCPKVCHLPHSLGAENNAPHSQRDTPQPTIWAGWIQLDHSFEPPTGFSPQS